MNNSAKKEINVASEIALSILEKCNSNNVKSSDVKDIMGIATSIVNLCVHKAQAGAIEKLAHSIAKKAPKDDASKEESAEISEEVHKAANAVDHMFHAYTMLESFLAKSENREINTSKLTKVAKRITRACFKDVKNVNVHDIQTEVVNDKDGISVNVVISKKDEEQ